VTSSLITLSSAGAETKRFPAGVSAKPKAPISPYHSTKGSSGRGQRADFEFRVFYQQY
jgi:hypothetical protein